MHLSEFIERLAAQTGFNPKKSDHSYVARCPAHDDRNPSLSITEGNDGKVLMKCFAGCSLEAICQSVDVKVTDLFPETRRASNVSKIEYHYRNAEGRVLFSKIRLEPGLNGKKKSFYWERLGVIKSIGI